MVKYILILAFVLGLAYEFTRTPGKGFAYREATVVERTEYLESQADLSLKRMGGAISRNYGYFSEVSIIDTDVISQGVRINMLYDNKDAATNVYSFIAGMKEKLCPAYAKLPLADHNLKMSLILQDPKGRRVGNLTLNNSVCNRYLGS